MRRSQIIVSTLVATIIIFICNNIFAACNGTSPNWISTADYSSVNTCVSNASAGDTITIKGDANWSSTLTITRGINLVGLANPTITGKIVLIFYQPNSTAQSKHEILSISGFTFDGNNATSAEISYTGLIRVANSSAKDYVYLILQKNIFRNTIGRGVYIQGGCYGVAALNIFDRIAMPLHVFGNDYASWKDIIQKYGVIQNYYFEDNTIQFSSHWDTGTSGWMETGQGGRIVVRYNTWNYKNALGPGEFWDIHGLQSPPGGTGIKNCQNYSTMVAEYYGNKIINQVNAYRWMAHRGGWLLMFYNTLSGNTAPYIGITQYYCNTCQSAGSFNQKVDNSYYWKNTTNGAEKAAKIYNPGAPPYGCTSDPIIENINFFNYNINFNGTTGVGCGKLAARPITCTTGVGYWATDQSCSDFTGMVGVNPTTPIAGTLYKCTATNTWIAYYSPYTYPHPLR